MCKFTVWDAPSVQMVEKLPSVVFLDLCPCAGQRQRGSIASLSGLSATRGSVLWTPLVEFTRREMNTIDTYMRHTGKLNRANRRKISLTYRQQNTATLSPAVSNNLPTAPPFLQTISSPNFSAKRTQRSPEDTSSGRGESREVLDRTSFAPPRAGALIQKNDCQVIFLPFTPQACFIQISAPNRCISQPCAAEFTLSAADIIPSLALSYVRPP